jgi:hypothetical protein
MLGLVLASLLLEVSLLLASSRQDDFVKVHGEIMGQ